MPERLVRVLTQASEYNTLALSSDDNGIEVRMRCRALVARRLRLFLCLGLGASVLLSGCSYVVLGDSIGVVGGTTYATYYGEAIGAQPTVMATPGAMLDTFELRLRTDQSLRDAVAHADVVTVSIGSNDLVVDLVRYGFGNCNHACIDEYLSAFETQYARMLGELRGLTRARITVLDIYDPNPKLENSYVISKQREINAYIHQAACARGIRPASVAEAFNGPDGLGDPTALGYISPDGIHPSAAGARVIALAALAAHC